MAPPRPKAKPISAAIAPPSSKGMWRWRFGLPMVALLIKAIIVGLLILRYAGAFK